MITMQTIDIVLIVGASVLRDAIFGRLSNVRQTDSARRAVIATQATEVVY